MLNRKSNVSYISLPVSRPGLKLISSPRLPNLNATGRDYSRVFYNKREKNMVDPESFINPKKYSKRVQRLKFFNNFLHYFKLVGGSLLTIIVMWFLIAVVFSF
jgi:hypothetical protein